jgi:hypothetical protein
MGRVGTQAVAQVGAVYGRKRCSPSSRVGRAVRKRRGQFAESCRRARAARGEIRTLAGRPAAAALPADRCRTRRGSAGATATRRLKSKGAGCSRRPSCAHNIEVSVVIACTHTLPPAASPGNSCSRSIDSLLHGHPGARNCVIVNACERTDSAGPPAHRRLINFPISIVPKKQLDCDCP